MKYASPNVDGLSPIEELAQRLNDELALLRKAILDPDVPKAQLQLCVIVSMAGASCWKSYETLSQELSTRTGGAEKLAEKTINNYLSRLHTKGYLRRFEAKTPEAGGARLTHFQLARITSEILQHQNVVPFPSQPAGMSHPERSGSSRRAGSRSPSPLGPSQPGGTRKEYSSSIPSARASRRARLSDKLPAVSNAKGTKAVRFRDMCFVTTESEADDVYEKLAAETDVSAQLIIFDTERARLAADGKIFAKVDAND